MEGKDGIGLAPYYECTLHGQAAFIGHLECHIAGQPLNKVTSFRIELQVDPVIGLLLLVTDRFYKWIVLVKHYE